MGSDSHNERRNLSALSFAIIIFYLAGGHIDLEQVRFGIFTAHFDRDYVLTGAVWMALVWFAFRFWLTTKGYFDYDVLAKQLTRSIKGKFVSSYVQKRLRDTVVLRPGQTFSESDVGTKYIIVEYVQPDRSEHRTKDRLLISFTIQHLKLMQENGDPKFESLAINKISGSKYLHGQKLSIAGLRGLILKGIIALQYMYKEEGFSLIVVPYILFLFAVGLGVVGLFCA